MLPEFGNLVRPVRSAAYLWVAALLFALKYGIDWVIVTGYKQHWNPVTYALFGPIEHMRHLLAPSEDGLWRMSLFLFAATLPFAMFGFLLTVGRLRSARLSPYLALLLFVPVVNRVLFSILCVLPQRVDPEVLPPVAPPFQSHDTDKKVRAAYGIFAGVAVACAMAAVGVMGVKTYGYALFVGAPFVQAVVSVLVFGMDKPRAYPDCLRVGFLSLLCTGVALLLVAFEGVVCLAMALPLAALLTWLGVMLGFALQQNRTRSAPIFVMLAALMPAFLVVEGSTRPEPRLHEVTTAIVIHAPRETVWANITAFAPLPEPTELPFRVGIGYPISCTIEEQGVGAVRRCHYSTGDFVEPVTVWNKPSHLGFTVSEQPEPLREWSPYDIHPPHVHGFMEGKEGHLLLTTLPNGDTKLTAHSYYKNHMWPEAYWWAWSDAILHTIHNRVFAQVKARAEGHESR